MNADFLQLKKVSVRESASILRETEPIVRESACFLRETRLLLRETSTYLRERVRIKKNAYRENSIKAFS